MTLPDIQQIYDVVDGTWPAAEYMPEGPWLFRRGEGGGQRVSATTARQPVTASDIAAAETRMEALNQPKLFMIREGDEALDALLEAQGYAIQDPVNAYVAPVSVFDDKHPPRVTALLAWEPLAIMLDIWAKGGIGAGRVAVMHRAYSPKTGLIGRLNDHPAAAAFCAIHKGIAMVHALEVLPHQRKQSMGKYAMYELAHWAAQNGADHISLVVTQANAAGNALYTSLGMTCVGQYHYRLKRESRHEL
ncbi:GNAT family N-acetyltransferase [Lentibacter sp. XHP0401]|uniref:GNAT family N-acetyltransferase n=1 Tax=Lentibacter sp. XHP0401 TaxID=2984334 RepID=UPI0021E85A34|nr:GNAT family N-acetyltransferase [Lentibacter sp. XHP0401]MCV2893104.1 GNAT family N-acetyltransferase [Lentibacter sp. XHP0401]